ncbi:MAG: amino acid adenylation domain-containing protein [Actinomycetota bacterium]|nr:amino acid adenylation domain-containing protein [Actinomycetota bacterium]
MTQWSADHAVAGQPVALRRGVEITPMQRALWTSQRRNPTAPLQNMALLSHVQAPVDPDRLRDAFAAVVAASDVLRSRVVADDAGAAVRVGDEDAVTEVIELNRADAHAWAQQRVATPIDLAVRGYDSAVLVHADGTVSWYLALHHVITDATSSLLVYEATAAAYRGEVVDLDSYYGWARDLRSRPDRRRDRASEHWAGREPAPRVGRLYRAVTRPGPTSSRAPVPLDRQLLSRVGERLQGDLRVLSDDLSWASLLVTSAAAYLHRVTGAERFSIGLPVHNRSDGVTRRLVGPIMEVFPVDVTVEPGDTYRDLHRRVGRAVMTTLRHAVPGTAPGNADVEAVVNVIPRAGLGAFGPLPATTEWIHPGASDPSHLFRLQLTTYGDGIELVLDLNHAAAGARHRDRAPGHLTMVLEDLVTDPDRPLGHRSLCGPDELAATRRWGRGADAGPMPPPITHTLARSLTSTPGVVLSDGDRAWTGPQLWADVTATAGRLRGLGAGPGARVGVGLDRSAEAVVAILATMVTGASYVPIDPAQPEARRRRLAGRAGVVTVIDHPDAVVLHTDENPDGASPGPAGPDDEAYLLFTSGSTGEPKGVPITHRGLARYLDVARRQYTGADAPPVVPLFSALTFDLTVTSLFLPLCTGGHLVVVHEAGTAGLRRIAGDRRLTWMKATPSHLELLVRLVEGGDGPGPALATLVVGGEAFPAALARRLDDTFAGVRIINEYGPTEAVVGCMIHEHDPEAFPDEVDVPIGSPAPGVTLRLLDRHGSDVPEGSPGELHIAHEGLTEGYLGAAAGDDPDSPFVMLDGVRFYRSGDLARLVDPHTLTYLGRADQQVKVGGIRLEPNEVAAALAEHPAIARAAVRLWSPRPGTAATHCTRCGLPSDVPGATFDDDGVCSSCHDYERIRDQAAVYFRTPDDLRAARDRARARRTGRHDCIHLLSGGKDSTYALYQLVEMGFDVYALTLDNGFISEGAKENVRRSVADLGIEHEFATTDAMNEIFRDSLERHSNVCHGCYKTIYTLATRRALDLGAPLIVTGLSRGQLFETRLVPAQFSAERFDPDAIDRAVVAARAVYHRADDAVRRELDTSHFDDDAVFERVEYLDFYRYVDVELAEMLAFLDTQAPWVRPRDTGRSTNCLINAAGIATHLTEQGFHNYAVPYAWDVRLGHKTRDEAMAELDDRLDPDEVADLLDEVGYRPRRREVLVAWYEPADGTAAAPEPVELRTFLAERLPAHAVPQAFVAVGALPMTTNGKLDDASLPAPARVHRPGPALYVSPSRPLEAKVVAVWEQVLGTEPIGVADDFFSLGGDSLAALEMAMRLSTELGRTVREDLAFVHTTPRDLAAALVAHEGGDAGAADGTAVAGLEPAGEDGTVTGSHPTVASDDPAPRPAGVAPPLSIGEQSILFEQLSRPDDPRYHVARRYTVTGDLDPARFREALEAVVDAHVPLHWTFGEPRRQLAPSEAVAVEITTSPVAPEAFAEATRRLHRAPFDLDAGPLGRALVQPLDDGTWGVALVFHHISIDAGSFDRLWDELSRRYQGATPPPAPFDYADHHAWIESRLDDADRTFWSAPERTRPAATVDLAAGGGDRTDGPGASDDDHDAVGGYRQRPASVDLATLRTGPGRTPFATTLAAFVAALAARSDGGPVGVGLTTSTRDHPGAEGLVGYYLNTVPVLVDAGPDDTFATVARRCAEQIGGALAHRTYPFARIVADRRAAGLAPPATRVLVAYEELAPADLGGREANHEVLASGSTIADATFFVQVRGQRVDLGLEHDTTVIDAAGADALLAEVDAVLAAGLARPTTPLADLPTARGAEPDPDPGAGSPVPDSWHGADRPALRPAVTIDRLIADAAAAHPDTAAVTCGELVLTHAELDRRANRLAHRLRSLAVGPEVPVVVDARRSAGAVAAIIGVLRAGGAHVPVDLDQPRARTEALLASTAATVVVTIGRPGWERPAGVRVVALGADGRPVADTGATNGRTWPDAPPEPTAGPDDLAYVLHTSGSTGAPKGVMVEHRQIVASTLARRGVYDADPERFLVVSPFAFDSSMAGLLWTLVGGGTVVLPDGEDHRDVHRLAGLIARHRVTHLLAVPSLYQVLVEEADAGELASLRTAIVAGEACTAAVVAAHRRACPDAELVNEYGPTEATVWSHAYRVPADHTGAVVPIGRPVPNVVGIVLDEARRPVPVGEPGELHLGGAGVARGYLGLPDATAERFVHLDARSAGAHAGRFYRTGDLVSWTDGGDLVFHGRVDHQVKVRGHRVEPAEIEAAIAALDTVREAAVITEGTGASLRLVAFVITDGTVTSDELRRRGAQVLPDHLLPARIELVADLPRTTNGKIDRAALGSRLPGSPAAETTEPTETTSGPTADAARAAVDAHAVAGLWREVLDVATVGPDDDFFDLGGDSLVAIRVFARIRRRFGVELPLPVLFEAATPRALATRIASLAAGDGNGDAGTGDEPTHLVPITRGTDERRPPIYCVHGLGGNVLNMRALAVGLGSAWTFVGIQAAGVDGLSPLHQSTDEICEAYLAELRAHHPGGPFVLAGYSNGGLIAYELAQRLEAEGASVAAVVLLDTIHPDHAEARIPPLTHLRELRRRGPAYLLDRVLERRRRAGRRAAAEALDDYEDIPGHAPPWEVRERRLFVHNKALLGRYRPTRWDGRVIMMSATDDWKYQHLPADRGWSVVVDGIEVIRTPGDHVTLMEEPHASVMAERLGRALGGVAR